ncbi:MAG: pyridoxal phosphate-dependent aminotransferase [Candidatus Kariarchaeaceae archaeon]|jgi:aspartate/methionine/tyrosine aminotransferase
MDTSQFIVEQAKMLDAIKPSGIRKMFARAQGLEGVISLGIGAPDLLPPQGLRDEVKKLLDDNRVHSYTLNSGILPLRENICRQYSDVYGLNYSSGDVVVGSGGTQLMYGTVFAYTNPGDEVIVPDPGFVYYPTIPQMAGCKVKPIPLDDNFQMSPDLVAEAISEKTKLIIINSPGNPTGVVLNNASIKGIGELATDHELTVFSDEVYEFITYDGVKHTSMATYAYDNAIILNSFSKTYCVPGWRLGYAIAPSHLIAPLAKINPYMIANAPSLPQYAIANFMGTAGDKDFRKSLKETMEKRRDIVATEFSKIPDVSVPNITGSFYAFPKIESERYQSANPGEEFVEDIFDNAKVVTVPGSEFGDSRNDNFRISFGSASEDKLKEAAQRIIDYIA